MSKLNGRKQKVCSVKGENDNGFFLKYAVVLLPHFQPTHA